MYTFNILNDKDFDSLPKHITRGSNINDSLGFADPDTGKAYVRNTGVKDLNRFLIDHEFDELVMDKSAHEDENGIRHKKFRQMAAPVVGAAGPIIGGALGGPLGAAAGGALGGAASSYLGGDKREFGTNLIKPAAVGGAMGFGGSKLTGNFGLPSATPGGFGNLGSNLGSMFKSGFGLGNIGSNLSGMLGKFGIGSGTAQAATGAPNMTMLSGAPGVGTGFGPTSMVQGVTSGAGNPLAQSLMGPVAKTAASAVSQPDGQPSTAGGGGSFMDMFKGDNAKKLLGPASLLGGLMAPMPEAPGTPQSIQDLQARMNAGGGPLAQQAGSNLSGIMNEQFNPMSEAEIQAANVQFDRQQEDAEDQIRDTYKNLRPGADEFTDSALRDDLNDMRQRFAESRSNMMATRTRDLQNIHDNRQTQAISQAFGVDANQAAQLTQLAEYDANVIANQLGIDLYQAQQLKQTLLSLGSEATMASLFPEQNDLMSLFNKAK